MPAVRKRGFALITATVSALLASACGADHPSSTFVAGPSASAAALPASAASGSPAPGPSAGTKGSQSPKPAPVRTGGGSATTGASVARPCRMADLRVGLSLATPIAGPYGSGSVQFTNVAADKCRLSGYITVRWLDSGGRQMPVSVQHLPGSMPGYTSLLQPGRSASAGLEWTRSRALPSDPDIPCPPVPASLEATLSTETNFARMAWTPGDGLCDSKAGVRPIEMNP